MEKYTPMIEQYRKIKGQHADAVLFFRLGDFYEMFFEDAEMASLLLGITLTSREAGNDVRVPMCGVPYHAADNYIAKLIQAGMKVAVCEQVSDPAASPGLVEREVIRIITPGTVIEGDMLEPSSNNFISSLALYGDAVGLAYADVSTGCLKTTQFAAQNEEALANEIARLSPTEFVVSKEFANSGVWSQNREQFPKSAVNTIADEECGWGRCRKVLLDHFDVATLDGFGCEQLKAATAACGMLLTYLEEVQRTSLSQFTKIIVYSIDKFMVLDAATQRHLELFPKPGEKGKEQKNSLLEILGVTRTSMGGRFLKAMIAQPLLEIPAIERRLDAVGCLKDNLVLRREVQAGLSRVYDLERLMARISYGSANARDLLHLKVSLVQIPEIASRAAAAGPVLQDLAVNLDGLPSLVSLLERAINKEAPATVGEGNLIREGYVGEIDELRAVLKNNRQWILDLEIKEKARTGIKSLKVKYNRVFGYFIEITNPNLESVPPEYVRKQTLVNCERFITDDLKEYENRILGAEERLMRLEYEVFCQVRDTAAGHILEIQKTAETLAEIDALCSLAEAAAGYDYQRPSISSSRELEIVQGRHPLVERAVGEENFVANDILLDTSENQLLILTGPNMSGKSTYLRQTALICIMAQIGSFVPARSAKIGIVDRVFTRIGAADDITTGRSTFMVEMNEVSNIVHNAGPSSLILLDEVGRGTATFDGLSLAWALAEHLAVSIRARTLFATHYHELVPLEKSFPGVKNYNVVAREVGDRIVFLHKVIPGGSDRSYGIQVARLAGLPETILDRADEILKGLEGGQLMVPETGEEDGPEREQASDEVLQAVCEIATADMENLTPLQALNLLHSVQVRLNSAEAKGKRE